MGMTTVNHVLSFLAVSSACSNYSVLGIWFWLICCNESTSPITKHGMSHEIQHTIQIENPWKSPDGTLSCESRTTNLSVGKRGGFYTKCRFDPRCTTHRLRKSEFYHWPISTWSNLNQFSKKLHNAIPFVSCFKTPDVVESVEPSLVHLSFHLTHLNFNRSPLKSYLPKRKVIFQPSFSIAMLDYRSV